MPDMPESSQPAADFKRTYENVRKSVMPPSRLEYQFRHGRRTERAHGEPPRWYAVDHLIRYHRTLRSPRATIAAPEHAAVAAANTRSAVMPVSGRRAGPRLTWLQAAGQARME